MDSSVRPKPAVLVVLDGWGITSPSPANPISLAKLPNLKKFQENYPVMTLQASGEAVGLSWGELGNSEVGHLSLGSGKIIYQSLPRINRAIGDGSFFTNAGMVAACDQVKKNNSQLHLMGLLSAGGVHAYYEHLYALVELAKNQNITQLYLHIFLDGRDMPFNSGLDMVTKLQHKLVQFGLGKIATISGRFYAMDRDNHWERIEQTYNVMTQGLSDRRGPDVIQLIQGGYSQQNYDEEFIPAVITKEDGSPQAKVQENDAIIFFNFRADRARELTKAFVLPGFAKFNRPYLKNLFFVSMMEYEKDLPLTIAFPPEQVGAPLAKVISEAGLKQLHIAETEKYAHVTFFFNGGQEVQYPGEERILAPSPRVASYDQVPAMAAPEITKKLLEAIRADQYDFIVVNFANADMVAHTGNNSATIVALELLDDLVGQIGAAVLDAGGLLVITADHGNAEELFNPQTGAIDKEHSTNPVPCYFISQQFSGKSVPGYNSDLSQMTASGVLADVAPTILKIMGLKRPAEMTGRSLI